MGKRALGIGLTLLSIALWVGPIAAAFAANNFDLKSTIIPSQQEMNDVKDQLEGIVGDEGFSEDSFNVESSEVDLTSDQFEVVVSFTSPFTVPVTIKEFSGEIVDQQDYTLSTFHLKNEVSISAGGSGQLVFVGSLTSDGKQRIINVYGGNAPSDVSMTNATLKVRLYGISVEVTMEEESGGSGGSIGKGTSGGG